MTPAHTLNLFDVLSVTKRIINTRPRHFLALSVIFLLPLSCSIAIYPTLHSPNAASDVVSSNDTFKPPQTLIFPLIYALAAYLLSICALAAITYSTYHGFFGRSVNLLPVIKSILFSFFPLVTTALAAKFIICLISVSFLMFVLVTINLVQNLGFVIDYDSSSYFSFGVALGLVMLYLHAIWGLAPVIAVTESKLGFEPLWRSSYLMKGMRLVSLLLSLCFGLMIANWAWLATQSLLDLAIVEDWRSLEFVLKMIICCSFLSYLTLMLLYYTVAYTVLYMYSKALHGELDFEVADEFTGEYVSLPVDAAKVPQIVTVVV